MKDVTFTLKDSTGVVRGTGTTGENGELTFTGLMLGETYTLHEDRVSGYQPAADKKIELSAEYEAQVYEVKWENVPTPSTPLGSITLTKVDASTGKALAGVVFELFDEENLSWGWGKTDSDGKLTFEELPAGKTYTCLLYTSRCV